MPTRVPLAVVIAEPNGAAKSTMAPRLLQEALAVSEFVNADAIAMGLSAFRPDSVAIGAGRIMLARLRALAQQRADFAFEDDAGQPELRAMAGPPAGLGISRASDLSLALRTGPRRGTRRRASAPGRS
jgi:hypothetical protein